ncbi:hypothetical protein AXF42_Ash020863 [Apostasia shenzhenica]|uniref:RNase H type-1 domain-containing protein n=1 Tax=Apostasia shenzhenica TaxID=1088818 RepID=A0A2H9ZRX9_9ASPA|nr:hypothetical protein AXF42_Ash020863 [Apostasia shenzhenica]
MVKQVNHVYEIRDDVLRKYLAKVHVRCSKFIEFSLNHVPREKNQEADRLAKRGSHDFYRHQTADRTNYEVMEIHCVTQAPCWMNRIIDYLKGSVPSESQKLRLESVKYVLLNNQLYRISYARPLTKCLRPDEAVEVMRSVYQGECETHALGRSLVMCILHQGFFWPTSAKMLRRITPIYRSDLQVSLNQSTPHGPLQYGGLTSWVQCLSRRAATNGSWLRLITLRSGSKQNP